jgi:signal transduction histidine kinase
MLVTTGLLAVLLLASALVGALSARRFADEVNQTLNRSIAMYIADKAPLIVDGQVMDETLRDISAQAKVLNPSIALYLLDPQGHVLWPTGALATTRVELAPIREFLSAARAQPAAVYGEDPAAAGRLAVFSAASVSAGGGDAGFVYVVLGGAERGGMLRSIADSHILRLGLTACAALLAFAIAVAWVLTARLTRPLRRLHGHIIEAAHGLDLGFEAKDRRAGDDLERVSAVFDALAAQVRRRVAELRTTDQARRELLAQVSHDLRTPVSAMRGYLETLASSESSLLPVSRQAEFALIALRHCDRLHRLLEQVFTLARIELAALPVRHERVFPAELAQDLAASMQLAAQRGAVRLHLDVDSAAGCVFADVALLETVLENLLDNALRHTPPGGDIQLLVQAKAEGVHVAVRDTGAGIEPAELGRLRRAFEAGPGGRTGLGLAIVSRILELHGSRLHLTRESGGGTRACFDLPRAPAGRDESVNMTARNYSNVSDAGREHTPGVVR